MSFLRIRHSTLQSFRRCWLGICNHITYSQQGKGLHMNIQIQKQHVEQLESSPLSSRVSLFQLAVPVLPRVLVSDSRFPTPYGQFPFPNPRVACLSVSESQFPNPCFLVSESACLSFRILVSESGVLVSESESAFLSFRVLVSESALLVSESQFPNPPRACSFPNPWFQFPNPRLTALLTSPLA